ncbi:MAG: hypothetical protein ABSG46_02645, partial [Candidatus Binataceae bacterium]
SRPHPDRAIRRAGYCGTSVAAVTGKSSGRLKRRYMGNLYVTICLGGANSARGGMVFEIILLRRLE